MLPFNSLDSWTNFGLFPIGIFNKIRYVAVFEHHQVNTKTFLYHISNYPYIFGFQVSVNFQNQKKQIDYSLFYFRFILLKFYFLFSSWFQYFFKNASSFLLSIFIFLFLKLQRKFTWPYVLKIFLSRFCDPDFEMYSKELNKSS
jgi:hypothetical protein